MISVLFSAFNDGSNPYLWKSIEQIRALQQIGLNIEVIVGATSGHDDTIDRLSLLQIPTVVHQTSCRGERYNQALVLSRANNKDWIVLHHPRSVLQPEAFKALGSLSPSLVWGAFTHRFDQAHPLLSFTSWYSNQVRGDLRGIFYLDHCLFVRRDVFEQVGGFPKLEVFEDTALSVRLRARAHPQGLSWVSTTSAVRFEKNGIWNQALRNQFLKLRYFAGQHHTKLNLRYEQGLDLNR